MLKLYDTFKNNKFEYIINYNELVINKINNLKNIKDIVFNNMQNDFIDKKHNSTNVLNRLYLINDLIDSLEDELNNLNNDYDEIINKDLDNKIKYYLNDEKYSKIILKPFLPYILLSSITNLDKFNKL